jgi:Dimerisation domain
MSAVFGYMAAQMLAAAVRLGVADHLGEAEWDAADVAAGLRADPGATRRLLQGLAALGMAAEPRPGVFTRPPAAGCCAPGSPWPG